MSLGLRSCQFETGKEATRYAYYSYGAPPVKYKIGIYHLRAEVPSARRQDAASRLVGIGTVSRQLLIKETYELI